VLAAGEEHVAGLAAALDQVAGQGDQRGSARRLGLGCCRREQHRTSDE
jgi:hypothetical protein